MPSHLSDSEVLEQTAEWLSRLADTIERITERMADRIATISAEQERQADEIRALSNRVEAVTRLLQTHGAALGDVTTRPRLLEPEPRKLDEAEAEAEGRSRWDLDS